MNPPNLGVFAKPVTVAGSTYDGSGSMSWDYDHLVDGQFARYQFPAGVLKASVGPDKPENRRDEMEDENEQIAHNSSYSRQKVLNSPAKFGFRHGQA
jgi:hypothetical protein